MGVRGRYVVCRRRLKGVVGRSLTMGAPASVFRYQSREKPEQAHDGGDNGVGRDGRVGRVGELQTQSAIDDAQDNGASTEPKMQVGPGGPPASFLQSDVV